MGLTEISNISKIFFIVLLFSFSLVSAAKVPTISYDSNDFKTAYIIENGKLIAMVQLLNDIYTFNGSIYLRDCDLVTCTLKLNVTPIEKNMRLDKDKIFKGNANNKNSKGTVKLDKVKVKFKDQDWQDLILKYNNFVEVNDSYLIYLEYSKTDPSALVDLIPVWNNVSFDKWAWWDTSWIYKKPIYVNTSINVTDSNLLLNITYSDGMKSDFGDLRFLNADSNLTLLYNISQKVNGSWAAVLVNGNWTSNNSTQLYMYYNNSLANTTSSVLLSPTGCYQEFANVSETCGAIGNGTYSGDVSYPLEINYTKPIGVGRNTSYWRVKLGLLDLNVTVPQSCWDYNVNKILFRLNGSNNYPTLTETSVGSCYNGSWINITILQSAADSGDPHNIGQNATLAFDGNWSSYIYYTPAVGQWVYSNVDGNLSYARLYEEAMNWNNTAFNFNYSLGGAQTYQNSENYTLNLTNCSYSNASRVLTYYVKDEDTNAPITNFDLFGSISLTDGYPQHDNTISIGFYNVSDSNISFCLYPSSDTVNITQLITYKAVGYGVRTSSLNSTNVSTSNTVNQTLYLPNYASGGYYTFYVRSPNNLPVENAIVTVSNVNQVLQTMNTNPDGTAVTFLKVSQPYIINVSASGYANKVFNFTPTPSLTTMIVTLESSYIQPVQLSDVFKDINWTLTPNNQYYFTSKFNITLKISSNGSNLSYWGMKINKYFNNTDTVVFNQNKTTASGGTLQYNISNNSIGKYTVTVWFKHNNFTEIQPAPVSYFYVNQTGVSQASADIKDQMGGWSYFFIAVIVAMLVAAFVSQYSLEGGGVVALLILWGFAFFNPWAVIQCYVGSGSTCTFGLTVVTATLLTSLIVLAGLMLRSGLI